MAGFSQYWVRVKRFLGFFLPIGRGKTCKQNRLKLLGVEVHLIRVPVMLQKCMLCLPFLHGWKGSWGQQIQDFAQGAMKQMLARGHDLRALGETGSTENQDGQHKMTQPRGSFPNLMRLVRWLLLPNFGGGDLTRQRSLTLQPLLFEKTRETQKKSKGFSLCRTPKMLGKERKNAPKKARKIGKGKSREVLGSVFGRTDFSRILILPRARSRQEQGLEGQRSVKKSAFPLKEVEASSESRLS